MTADLAARDLVHMCLGLGRDNAKPIGLLAEQQHLSRREVEQAVQTLRLEGIAVCSGNDGIWLGDTETRSAKGYSMPSIAPPSVQTTGWRPTCRCEQPWDVPCQCAHRYARHIAVAPDMLGYRAGCQECECQTYRAIHGHQSQPAVVLDPFAGSGTTGMVANRLSRRAILIDLNGDYLKQQLQRNAQTPLGLGAA